MRAQSKVKRAAATVIYHVFVISLCFVMLYPILWLIMSSFKPSEEVFRNASSLWPEHFTFRNYAEGWKGFGGTSFGTFFKNSLFVASVSTVAQPHCMKNTKIAPTRNHTDISIAHAPSLQK